MNNIIIAMEDDLEVCRHHMSMSVPFGAIGVMNHRWYPKQISAYDMFDTIKPDLVMCSQYEWYKNNGFREYVINNNINCLIRHEYPGDVLADNTITYTRYKNSEFKEYLPACADIINFQPYKTSDSFNKWTVICMKNYLPKECFYGVFLNFKQDSLYGYEKQPVYNRIKIFRGYNTNSPYHFGDITDAELSKIICKGNCKVISPHRDIDSFVTSDVLNAIHCAGYCEIDYKHASYNKVVYDYFEANCGSGCFDKEWMIKNGKKYTNFDRAIEISKLFNLQLEKELQDAAVKYL